MHAIIIELSLWTSVITKLGDCAMQMNRKSYATHLVHLLYEGSILFFYVLGLVMAVALGAFALDLMFSPL